MVAAGPVIGRRRRRGRSTDDRWQLGLAGAVRNVWVPAACDRARLDAHNFRAIGRVRVRVAGVADAVADLFALPIPVRVPLIRVGDEGAVVAAVQEAVTVMVRRLVRKWAARRLVGGWVTAIRDAVGCREAEKRVA